MQKKSSIWIMDAGGSKVSSAVFQESKWQEYVYEPGIVPYMLDEAELFSRLQNCYLGLRKQEISQVYYYGSGCNLQANSTRVKLALQKLLPKAQIQVMHDVFGAARAVCGINNGVVAILGTGSSACWYDGEQIPLMRAGLGYILGDEGSGADLGRRLIRGVLYEELDENLCKQFYLITKLDADTLINKVYYAPGTNQFLASFSKFIYKYLVHKQIKALVYAALNSFVQKHLLVLSKLSACQDMYFVGGIAYYYQDILADILREHHLNLATIIHRPITGLIKYHSA